MNKRIERGWKKKNMKNGQKKKKTEKNAFDHQGGQAAQIYLKCQLFYILYLFFFKWDPHPVVEVEDEGDVVDDLFSTKGWPRQKSGNAYEGDEDAIYVSMKKLAVRSYKLIFDKQDRSVHPGAIATTHEKNQYSSTIRIRKRNTDL